jgi:hypothetical protein
VDPIAPAPLVVEELRKPGVRYFESTSDAFFELAAPEALAEGVDVVFIDGLHTYAQAYRDTIHALEYLTPGGIVLLHDCLPANENEATEATSGDEVRAILEAKGVEWDGAWTGDVWKAIVALRRHAELETDVLNCDCGVGVVRRGTNDEPLRISDAEIEAMQFGDLAANARQLLGLRTPAYLEWVLSSRGK